MLQLVLGEVQWAERAAFPARKSSAAILWGRDRSAICACTYDVRVWGGAYVFLSPRCCRVLESGRWKFSVTLDIYTHFALFLCFFFCFLLLWTQVYDRFVARATELARKLRQGPVLGKETVDCGAMVMPAQLDIVQVLQLLAALLRVRCFVLKRCRCFRLNRVIGVLREDCGIFVTSATGPPCSAASVFVYHREHRSHRTGRGSTGVFPAFGAMAVRRVARFLTGGPFSKIVPLPQLRLSRLFAWPDSQSCCSDLGHSPPRYAFVVLLSVEIEVCSFFCFAFEVDGI